MISYVKGILEYIGDTYIIIEAGGLGYKIFVSSMTISTLPTKGNNVKIFTFMSVKDDGVSLFGFASMEEMDIFNKLITVSGVGPKGALGFLAYLTPSELMLAIVSDDIATLSKAPGVGKKTAQRVVLELKDKFKTDDFLGLSASKGKVNMNNISLSSEPKFETIEALTSLGYTRSEAAKVVSEVYIEGIETEELLKLALKKMIKL